MRWIERYVFNRQNCEADETARVYGEDVADGVA